MRGAERDRQAEERATGAGLAGQLAAVQARHPIGQQEAQARAFLAARLARLLPAVAHFQDGGE